MTMGPRIARLASVAIVLAALLAGCTGGSTAGASPVATTSVDLPPSYRFAPADIGIAAGATVTWTNNDHFSHSVQFLDGGLPTDPLVMDPGQAATFTFDAPGTYAYQCHLHPQNMKGTVRVTN
jgi:plastocyanin